MDLNKFINICFIELFLFYLTGFTQEWIARYNGTDNLADGARSVAIDNNGNIYVTGASANRTSFLDIVTIKYRPNGEIVWIARYNGPGNYDDIPVKLVLDQKGNLYIAGTTFYREGIIVESDFVTLKYDTSGNLSWVALYDGPGSREYDNDQATSLIVDSVGNVYITGQSSGGPSTFFDYALIKYDSLGRVLWIRRYETEYWDQPWDMTLDDSNNVYVTGGYSGGGPTHYDYLTLKYSPEGELLGAMIYSGPALNFDVARAISIDEERNIYVTGTSWLSASEGMGIVTIKYNSEGRMVWEAIYRNAEAGGILVRRNSIYVFGSAITSNGIDILLIKYDSEGSEIWSQIYNGPTSGDDYGIKAVLDNFECIYITGISAGTQGNDYVTIKYNQNGQILWVNHYDGGNEDNPFDLAVDNLNNLVVTGESFDSLTSWDYLTIKYSNIGKIIEREILIPEINLKIVSEPEFIKVKYWLPKRTKINLKIYDLSGKLIKIISTGIKEKGNHSEHLKKKELKKGLYILILESYNYRITKKFFILK